MARLIPNDPPGVPDDESPEWTENDFLWSVAFADFGDHRAVFDFLARRESILRSAESKGLKREAFLPLLPNKPGFEERVADAFGEVMRALPHAAE